MLLSIYELKLLIPWLINLGIKQYKVFIDIVIPLCISNYELIYAFFFECEFFMKDKIFYYNLNNILNKFLSLIDKTIKKELYKTVDFVKFINENIF